MKTIYKADDSKLFDDFRSCQLYEKLLAASKTPTCNCFISPDNIAELAKSYYLYLDQEEQENEAIRTSKENLRTPTES